MPLTIRGRQLKFSLAWLKPPPLPPDGNMTLFEHLRELRYRLVIACLAIVVTTVVAFFFGQQLFDLLVRPYNEAIALVKVDRPDIKAELVIAGATAPFTISLKVSALAGLIVSSPIWIYQIWAFIVPGLLAKERKWTLIVVGVATPLFLAGVALCYYVLPKALAVLIKFTPEGQGITNLQSLGDFFGLMTRLMIVFGLAFEVPLFILMLNIVGVLPAKTIAKYRVYLIFGSFVFAAVATPTPDAFVMLLLAVPMTVLVLVSEILAHLVERRRRTKAPTGDEVANTSVEKDAVLQQLSKLDETPVVISADGDSDAGDKLNR